MKYYQTKQLLEFIFFMATCSPLAPDKIKIKFIIAIKV